MTTLLRAALSILLAAAWATPAAANVPEPDQIFYGLVAIDGQPVTAATIELRSQDGTQTFALGSVGTDDDAPTFYVLPVRLEQPEGPGDPATPNVARTGDTGVFYVNGLMVEPVVVGQRGQFVRFDLSASTPSAPAGANPDTDGDGVSDVIDNCSGVANVVQTDSDGNGVGDACESLVNPGAEFVEVRAPGGVANAADSATGYGSVSYTFMLQNTEVTNVEYVEFLNAVARSDPHGLFSPTMASDPVGGIVRLGAEGAWTYQVKPSMGDKPVNYVSWLDAARYANWLQNRETTGSTETGAFDLTVDDPGVAAVLDEDAEWSLPTEDEWYKAAYYDPTRGFPDDADNYWIYPTRADVDPIAALADAIGNVLNPGPNVANYEESMTWGGGAFGNVGTVGSAGAPSHFETHDQGGNVAEWTAAPVEEGLRVARGGGFTDSRVDMQSAERMLLDPASEAPGLGFRVLQIASQDSDGDGVPDVADNCTALPNGPDLGPNDQLDGDGDGFGDVCDCDFNNDGSCTVNDFGSFFLGDLLAGREQSGAQTDMNGDGFVNLDDFSLFLPGFQSGRPGPSGIAP